MSSNFYRIDQFSTVIDNNFFYPFYETLSQAAERHPNIAYAAPLIGAADGLANLIQGSAAVVESGIKGLANLFWGIMHCNNEPLKVGAIQLGLGVGVVGILLIPQVAFRTIRITYCMARDPVMTSKQEFENYRKKIHLVPI